MLIFRSDSLVADATDTPVSPLNAIWFGELRHRVTLPQLGHLFLVFPLGETAILCSGAIVDSDHYLWLAQPAVGKPFTIENLRPDAGEPSLVLLLLSPAFIADMADFLGIPSDLGQLLHAMPLLQGDKISRLLRQLALTSPALYNPEETEELFLEVVGQVLQLLRLRHQALLSLSGHKENTVTDLLPRMLQARQFIEARYLEPIKTRQVASHVGLSEYHFARLFKTAFEVTVHQYLQRLRLEESCRLLEFSTMSVTDIALTVGYSSLSAFIHAFRSHAGMAPKDYQSRFAK